MTTTNTSSCPSWCTRSEDDHQAPDALPGDARMHSRRMTTNTNANANALGDTPPTVCPRCAGPCTLPGEGPTGQLGGLCTVCGWDYLVAGVEAARPAPASALAGLLGTKMHEETMREWGPVPDVNACPAWCNQDSGHPWFLGDMPGDFARTHRAFYVEGAAAWSVEAYRIEEAHRGVVTMGAPGVGVQVSDELDAGQALQLAAAVKRAAESAQGIADALQVDGRMQA